MSQAEVKMPIAEAKELAEQLLADLKKAGAKRAEITGSLLREERYIGDIDVIVEGQIEELARTLGESIQSGSQTDSQRVILTYKGRLVNFFRGFPENWGAMRFYLTGPKGYVIGYRMRAKKKGYLLNQHGLFDKDNKKIAGETEEGLYEALDKKWKHPTERGKR